MAEISRFERVTDNIFKRLEKIKEAPQEPTIGLGMERVRNEVGRKRLEGMSPQARQKLIEKVGLEEVLKIVGNV